MTVFRRKSMRVMTVFSNTTPEMFTECSYFTAALAEEAAIPVNLTVLKSIPPPASKVENDDDDMAAAQHALYGIAPGQSVKVPYRGTNLSVRVEKVDAVVGVSDRSEAMYTLTAACSSRSKLSDFLKDAARTYERAFASQVNFLRIFSGTKHGYWMAAGSLPKRSPKTVILDKDLMSTLIHDVEKFMQSEDEYIQHGIPYKRVICLHGPPGTGKTSAIFALASHLNMNIGMLNVRQSGSDADGALIRLVNQLPRKTLLVIEDVDALYASRVAPENGKKSADPQPGGLSTILNILDGNLRKHGMIVCMTTNHPEHLDPAMLRPGRVDFAMRVGFATSEQASGLYKLYFPKDDAGAKKLGSLASKRKNLTTADLNMRLFSHRGNAKEFWKTLDVAES